MKDKIKLIIGWIVWLVQVALSAYGTYTLVKSKILPTKYLVILLVAIWALVVITRLLLGTGKKLVKWIVGLILSLVTIIAGCIGLFFFDASVNMIEDVTGVETETTVMCVYVLSDDPAETVKDAKDYDFGYVELEDTSITKKTFKLIDKDAGKSVSQKSYSDMLTTADALLNGDCKAIVLNEASFDAMTAQEGYEDFADKTKEIGRYEIKTTVETNIKSASEPFAVYISGSDSRSSNINAKSRSDVNILAIVNPTSHQILLLSTPRDYYVATTVSNGAKDKLTHAGIYGVDCSMGTLGMLYGIDVDYYFRINFTGFEEVIDALGGVDIVSDYDFTTTHGNYHIKKGKNHLNGAQALGFARERYSFANGDNQRGQDQMIVIKAVIDQATSSDVLKDYKTLMTSMDDSFKTNVPYDLVSTLINKQISSGAKWDVQSYAVTGTGSKQTTYSMPRFYAYVMEPDYSTVNKAKSYIKAVKEGKDYTVED